MVKTNRISVFNYLEGIFAHTYVNVEDDIFTVTSTCNNTRSAGIQLRRGHMILDHYAVAVDVHVRKDGSDSLPYIIISGNHYHSVRKLIGKFIIDSEEKFQ